MPFQQVLKSVLLKKVLSEGRRKEMAALAQKYAVGMLMAEKRHALAKECLDACLARFVQGECDNELGKTTPGRSTVQLPDREGQGHAVGVVVVGPG